MTVKIIGIYLMEEGTETGKLIFPWPSPLFAPFSRQMFFHLLYCMHGLLTTSKAHEAKL